MEDREYKILKHRLKRVAIRLATVNVDCLADFSHEDILNEFENRLGVATHDSVLRGFRHTELIAELLWRLEN